MQLRMRTRAAKVTAAVAVIAATTTGIATTGLVSSAAAASSPPTTTSAPKAAAGWLARQLTGSHHDHYATVYAGTSYPDAGETADGILAMDAAHVAQTAAARATKWLAAHAKSYATGSGYTKTYYPGALAKLLLVAEAQRANVHDFGGIDLVKALRAEEQPDGAFTNAQDAQFGNSPLTQALVLVALSHAGSYYVWPDAKSIAWLVGQQCGDGGFTATIQQKPAATCDDSDTTAFAAQALLTVHSNAAARALHWLNAHRNTDGGFSASGSTKSNANSTAVAVQALRQAGYSYAAPLKWLAKHQKGCSATPSRRGAVTYQSSYNQATALRATTQAAQALALRWLGAISKTGASSAAPVLKC